MSSSSGQTYRPTAPPHRPSRPSQSPGRDYFIDFADSLIGDKYRPSLCDDSTERCRPFWFFSLFTLTVTSSSLPALMINFFSLSSSYSAWDLQSCWKFPLKALPVDGARLLPQCLNSKESWKILSHLITLNLSYNKIQFLIMRRVVRRERKMTPVLFIYFYHIMIEAETIQS